jgi:hypothetical protein
MLTVGGSALRSLERLSSKAQTLLALIEGAERWLAWATAAPTPVFRFADEAALAAGVQEGLHGAPLMLVSRLGLLVHPRKLWTLGEEHLNQVLSYEGDDEENQTLASSLAQVLNGQGLFSQRDLDAGRQLLDELGQAGAPLFQALSLDDQVALLDLVKHPPSPLALDRQAQKRAVAFAIESAQTPREFCDLYALFFEVARQRGPKGTANEARRVRDLLAQPIQALLHCPVVTSIPEPVELYALLHQWAHAQQTVGLASVSSAMLRIVAAGVLPEADEDVTATKVRGFVDEVRRFVTSAEPSRRTLSQDGSTYSYFIETRSASARLDINQAGSVTLGTYQSTVGDGRTTAGGAS